ncbi:Serine/threonine-protein kinase mos [Halotydeus destructor]|nr:Serine/threonine-protein kinase mos [Halotydeus destructor]
MSPRAKKTVFDVRYRSHSSSVKKLSFKKTSKEIKCPVFKIVVPSPPVDENSSNGPLARQSLDSGYISPLTPTASSSPNAAISGCDHVFRSPSPSAMMKVRSRKRSQSSDLLDVPTISSQPSSPSSPRSSLVLDNFCNIFLESRDDSLVLGQGSFGCVYLSSVRQNAVAVKVCPQAICVCLGEVNSRFLRHPNVVRTHRVLACDEVAAQSILARFTKISTISGKRQFDSHGMQIVVMECAGKLSLQHFINDYTLTPRDLISVLKQIADAIAFLHEHNIVHMDLKPSNVMLDDYLNCKLIDFGCSRKLQLNHDHKECNQLIGTVGFTAPELFKGRPPSYQCDIYSFGIMMWQLMSRETPYQGLTSEEIIYRVVANNLRPAFEGDYATSYQEMIKSYSEVAAHCWHQCPQGRPTARQLMTALWTL